MNPNDINYLRDIMGDNDDNDNYYENNKGSVLNPSQINNSDKNKTNAKPFSKIETTINNRKINTKASNKDNIIWENDEILEQKIDETENRKEPEYECIHKQTVGSEDVYLGLSGLDPSSNKCQELLLRINLPETNLKEIQLDVKKNILNLKTPIFYLDFNFPYEVKEKESKAKWIKDKFILELSLPVNREIYY